MKWLTQKEIKAAGKKSKRAAVACAKKHWLQLATATENELTAAWIKRVNTGQVHCALCRRYWRGGCKKCPFSVFDKRDQSYGCPSVYDKATNAREVWWKGGSYSKFQKAAQKVYEALCKL